MRHPMMRDYNNMMRRLKRIPLRGRPENIRKWEKMRALARIYFYIIVIRNGKRRGRSAKKMHAYNYALQYHRKKYREL